ncbi:hypothetical protein [Deinococcus yavapaiensis]|uniref:Carboxypeptidase family protein n=1 Tax=Deinococcus yavapaiensis KR-236 TaxID=694435 RepID=A0A318SLI5_9DEIO|nr:hypothetical protein [Deinococcus yavapaiensis]PYE55389.1 hypothetical protein DES52_103222 [Deinococcus yavapaiensis KR-236]
MRKIALSTALVLTSTALAASFSGTVQAPKGVDLKGATIVACAAKDGGCDEDASVLTTVSTSGAEANFQLAVQPNVGYYLLAWKDVNGNGDIDDGDYFARLSGADGAALKVQAPRANVRLSIGKLGAAPDSTSPAPSQKAVTPKPIVTKGSPGYVTGQVFDSLGRPLRGAFVTIDPAVNGYFVNTLGTFETDANGAYKVRLTPEVSWKAVVSANMTWRDQPMCLPGAPFGNGGFFFDRDGAVRHFRIDVNVADLTLRQEFVVSTNPAERPRFIGGNNVNRFKLSLKPLGRLVDGTTTSASEATVVASKSGGVDSTTISLRKLPLGRYELSLAYVESDGSLTPLLVHDTGKANSAFARTTTVDFDRIIGCGALGEVEYQFPR